MDSRRAKALITPPLSRPDHHGTFHPVPPLLHRLRAGLLLGLFLAGTIGLPVADAAMFHLAGRDPCAGVTHIEPQGGMHHADRCALAQPAAAQREALGSAKAVRAPAPHAERAALATANTPPDLTLVTLQHSRAPPA